MQYLSLAPQQPTPTSLSPDNAQLTHIHRHVEKVLRGKVINDQANSSVELLLFDHAMRHALVYAAKKLADALRCEGLHVLLRYCWCHQHGHPVPFLVTQDESRNFIIPEIFPGNPILAGSELLIIDCSKPDAQHRRTHAALASHAQHRPAELGNDVTFCDTPTLFTQRAENHDVLRIPGAAALVVMPG